jgi:hypothetical protein
MLQNRFVLVPRVVWIYESCTGFHWTLVLLRLRSPGVMHRTCCHNTWKLAAPISCIGLGPLAKEPSTTFDATRNIASRAGRAFTRAPSLDESRLAPSAMAHKNPHFGLPA